MKDSTVVNKAIKVVEAEYRQMFACEYVMVRIPLPNKYMRHDLAHQLEINGKTIIVPSHFVHGFVFPKTKLIMYKHYYVSEEFLGKTINAKIILFKKVYSDNRVQYILDIKPISDSKSKYELKIYTDKPNRNNDLGHLICLEGKAVGKVACKEFAPRN